MVSIAIDGPAGAGKSTAAKGVAQALSYIYVDTGALYRAIGLFAVENGIDTQKEADVCDLLANINIELRYTDNQQYILLNGKDVSAEIRKPEMSMAASNVSAYAPVRIYLLELQRKLAREQNVVMDGRDIGTVILPNAQVKIFLTASDTARAQRRYKEDIAKGLNVSYNDTLRDMRQRDYNDSNRLVAPLMQAEDAVVLDTSTLTLQQVIAAITKIAKGCGQ